MQNFFDAVNAYLLHHPDLLNSLCLLFWLKSWLLFLLMGVFLLLIYREDWQQRRQQRTPAAKYRLTGYGASASPDHESTRAMTGFPHPGPLKEALAIPTSSAAFPKG